MVCRAALVDQMVNNQPAMQETRIRSLGKENPLEEEMATHCSVLPGEFQGQRSRAGYSPWGRREPHRTKRPALSLSQWFVRLSQE